MNLFSALYFMLTAILFTVLLPVMALFSMRSKYRRSLPARFFLIDNPPFSHKGIWFHSCSVGETRALKPLLDTLKAQTINITTITQTGQEVARSYHADVRYLPLEPLLPFWIRPNQLLVVLEAELWYQLFLTARAKGAHVVLLNARISERSFPKYRRFRWFYRRLFHHTDKVFCQSEADKIRLMELGAHNVEVIGNIKLAQRITTSTRYDKPSGELIVAASTHDEEETLCVNAFKTYRHHHPESRLFIVPRHPERFDSVWQLIGRESGHLRISRWSEEHRLDADIVLIDAMGELNNFYAIADTVILGGAFREDVGGHNPLEPATFSCKLITGPHFYNQRELMRYVDPVQIVDTDDVANALLRAHDMPGTSIKGSFDLKRITDYLKENA